MAEIEAHESKLYGEFAPLYDKIFGKIFYNRIERVIENLYIPVGAKILEIGAGTGTSFPAYPNHCEVTGVDLAPDMLSRARQKIHENGWHHFKVMEMDALSLTFADNSFDYVTAFHTVTVVPDPIRMLAEAKRVCRPGGKIVIVNHFQSTNRFIALLEKWLCPLCTKLGWRSDLALQDLIRRTGVEIDYRYKLESIDLWETVVMTNNKSALQHTWMAA